MITTDIEIFLGPDVGKTDHWACAVTKDGTKSDKTLPNDEAKLIAVYETSVPRVPSWRSWTSQPPSVHWLLRWPSIWASWWPTCRA